MGTYYDINSFDEYIEYLKKYKKNHPELIWYRGQINSEWKLEPNLYRYKVLDVPKGEVAKLKYKKPDFLSEIDKFKEKIQVESLFDISSLNQFQIMFLGQHYGILTPVLDWTTDPLAALFFALDGFVSDNDNCPIIYLFKPGFCNSYSDKIWSDNTRITEPICIDGNDMDIYFDEWIKGLENPVSTTPLAMCTYREYSFRISRQSGNFTLHSSIQPLNYRWNDITIDDEKFADSITINPDAVNELREDLTILSINRKTLYKVDNNRLDDESKLLKDISLNEFHKSLMK